MNTKEKSSVFSRLGAMRRGHPFSNVATLHPVQEVEISDDGLALTIRAWRVLRRRFQLRWDQVEQIVVELSRTHKGIGATAVRMVRRMVTIRGGGRVFVFDASESYPDFERGAHLVRQLERHFAVTHVDKRR